MADSDKETELHHLLGGPAASALLVADDSGLPDEPPHFSDDE